MLEGATGRVIDGRNLVGLLEGAEECSLTMWCGGLGLDVVGRYQISSFRNRHFSPSHYLA
jgi:hypothetical protein